MEPPTERRARIVVIKGGHPYAPIVSPAGLLAVGQSGRGRQRNQCDAHEEARKSAHPNGHLRIPLVQSGIAHSAERFVHEILINRI